MSMAAQDIHGGDDKIIAIGLKSGYTSPTAFNPAFQSIHGVAPSTIKKEGTMMKVYLPISFKITVKGVVEMNYRIEEKAEFPIVGISEPLDKEVENNFKVIPNMW